jgi:hypothetical protein
MKKVLTLAAGLILSAVFAVCSVHAEPASYSAAGRELPVPSDA